MESLSKTNETFMDEIHKREADRVYYVCPLVCSILILCLIVASILIDCVRHYQRLSVQIRARAAEGGFGSYCYMLGTFLGVLLDGCRLGRGGWDWDWACLQQGEGLGEAH